MCSLSMQFSLLQSPPSRPCPSFLANHEPKLSTTSSSVTFPLKTNTWKCSGTGNLLVLRVKAYGSSSDSSADSSTPPNGTRQPKSRRDILLEYVQNVKPEFMEMFVKRAPKHVVEAMRQTVTNMIGTLPPQFFAVTVTSVAENLAQLMMSVLMTGYMFRNAQYRLELQQSLEQVALPEPRDQKGGDEDYAPGTQKNVSGEVIRWNNVSGPEKIDAKKYIELLEAEIEELNRQVGRKSANQQNEILEYLKSLEPQNLKELTSTAGEDVAVAMNTFVKRLLAVSYQNRPGGQATDEYGNPIQQQYDEYGNPMGGGGYGTGGGGGATGGQGYGTGGQGYGSGGQGYGTGGQGYGTGTGTEGFGTGGGARHHGQEQLHKESGGGLGGMLHRSGSGSSSSSEDDGQGGRRKKGITQKIKEKLPGHHDQSGQAQAMGGMGSGYDAGGYGGEHHEKKGMMDKIKEKLPGGGR